MNRLNRISIPILFMLIFVSAWQVKAQENPISICNDVQVIDSETAMKHNLFSEYQGFMQATFTTAADSTVKVEVIYKPSNIIKHEQKSISKQELAIICNKLNQSKLESIPIQNVPDNEGRRLLITKSMLYSLGFYGWAVPKAFDANDGRFYAASYMIIGSAGFFVPFLKTRHTTVSRGMAKGFDAGASLGIAHGLELGLLINGDNESEQTYLGLAATASVSEALACLFLARNHQLSYGRMGMIGNGGFWGSGLGFGASFIINENSPRQAGAMSFLTSLGGMYAGNYYAQQQSISEGDLKIINGLGLLGGYMPIALVNQFDLDKGDGKVFVASAMLGSLLGLKLGLMRTKTYDYDNFEGYLVGSGQVAGGLLGLGLVYLFIGENSSNVSPYLWASSIGALGGFWFTDKVVRNQNIGRRKKDVGSLHFELNPYSLKNMFDKQSRPYQSMNQNNNNYLMKLSYRF